MDILSATAEAFRLLLSGDRDLWEIILLSLGTAVIALVLIAPAALILAYILATTEFRGRQLIIALMQGFLSFPTIVIGLILYLLFSRSGPLGALQLLFTPQLIIIGQMLIAFPVLLIFTLAALQKTPARETARALGASRATAMLTVCNEARFALVAALLTGFGRIISEVGCALLVGGNIAHYTRTIPTAIALDTGKGAFAESIALGAVLIFFALLTSVLLSIPQNERIN